MTEFDKENKTCFGIDIHAHLTNCYDIIHMLENSLKYDKDNSISKVVIEHIDAQLEELAKIAETNATLMHYFSK